jgi:hypothetical protein
MKLQNKVLVLKGLSSPTFSIGCNYCNLLINKMKMPQVRIEVSLRNFTLGLLGGKWMTSSLFRLNG